MGLTLPLSILVTHFIADWYLQSDWMALNKSKHWDVLLIHGAVYALCFWPLWGSQFAALTFLSHIAVDFVTSRMTATWWFIDLLEPVEGTTGSNSLLYPTYEFARVYPWKRRKFFLTIGFDQLIHFTTLAFTLKYLHLI